MKVNFFYIILLSLILMNSCKEDDNPQSSILDDQLEMTINSHSVNGLDQFILPNSSDFTNIPQDPLNPLTPEKVSLGKLLYHETGLALNPRHAASENSYSCSTCHFASAGFQANRHQGISDGGLGFADNGNIREINPDYQTSELDVQPIRTPSAMNGAFQKNNLWNGQFGATGVNIGTESQWTENTPIAANNLGYEGLEIQAIAGLQVHRMTDIQEFLEEYYKNEMDAAFPNIAELERYNREYAGLAIAAYERALLSNKAPFQLWLKGDKDAMTMQEKEGAILFFGEAKCATCHSNAALSSMEFHGLGMKDLYTSTEITYGAAPNASANLGRGGFTKVAEDYYKFKVPQLYNMADSPFYGHGASFRTIREVVEYKNRALKENQSTPNSQISDEFVPLNLTDEQVDALTAFLTNSLRDPDLIRYQPGNVNSGFCFPVNDAQSKIDLGCD